LGLEVKKEENLPDWYSQVQLLINIILFVLNVQPNTTYKLFARRRKRNKQRCIEKSAIVNRYKES